MSLVTPSIDSRLVGIAPGFRALSILVEAAPITQPEVAPAALAQACQQMLNDDVPWAENHLAAWDEVFKAFGAKPKRTPCSASALRKRVMRDGSLPPLDPVVDIYNAISIRYAIPVGGENLAAYSGAPRLTLADGSEPFDTVKEGEPVVENPEPGEVIWRDDLGITCRRWNWRQGIRTRLDSQAQSMWFILESLPSMPLAALQEAGDELVSNLQKLMPGATARIQLLELARTTPGGASLTRPTKSTPPVPVGPVSAAPPGKTATPATIRQSCVFCAAPTSAPPAYPRTRDSAGFAYAPAPPLRLYRLRR